MNPKLVLTSLVAIAVASPAMAAVTTTGNFPVGDGENGLMKTEYIYTSAANSQNMGVSADNATATAAAYYQILPGFYLPANSYVVSQCVAGSFCSGINSPVTKSSSAQGTRLCSEELTGSGYNSSNSGSDSKFDCYKTCPTPTAADHLSGSYSGGGVYYGNLNNCTVASNGCQAGYSATNISAASDLSSKIGSAWEAKMVQETTSSGGTASFLHANYLDGSAPENSAWAIGLSDGGILYGRGICATPAGSASDPRAVSEINEAPSNSTESSSCYCFLTAYAPSGANRLYYMDSLAVITNSVDSDTCRTTCAQKCAEKVISTGTDSIRTLLFEHASNTNKCTANAYTITYQCGTGATGADSSETILYSAEYTTKRATYPSGSAGCSKRGYDFNKWSISGESGASATVPENSTISAGWTWATPQNKTYTGTWNANTYTITLNDSENSGTIIKEIYNTKWTNNAGTDLTSVAIPKRNEYTFKGYYENSEGTGSVIIPTAGTLPANTIYYDDNTTNRAKTLYSVFEKCTCTTTTGVASCTYVETPDSGASQNRCKYEITYAVTNDGANAYYGMQYAFGTAGTGAYTTTGIASPCTNKAGSAAETASGTEPHSIYTAGDNTDEGSCKWKCETGYAIGADKNAENSEYTSNGADLTCAPISNYSISYIMNGGSCAPAPVTTYTYGTGWTLCKPTKTGYTFLGWTGSNGDTPQTSVTIGATATGDKTYTANWRANNINILWYGIASSSVKTADDKSMSSFDNTNKSAKSQVSYDSNISTPMSGYAPDGQVFKGWKFVIPAPNNN